MEKHTPGPWVATMEPNGREFGVDAGRWGICICADAPGSGSAEYNARLIAAAPKLLLIAENLVRLLENCAVESGVCCCGDDMARHSDPMICGHMSVDSGAYYADQLLIDASAAIAKATGSES